MKDKLCFAIFADLHYKQGMYLSSVADLKSVLERADSKNAEFVIHCGDLCNDYTGSPEITNALLDNPYCMPVYGIYGNHELETPGNTMEKVTPFLTNRADEVVWGTEDGKIGNGDIAYYYFDTGDFRFIFTDKNYSYNEKTGEWQHNTEASWGPPAGNIKYNSLGPIQFEWLKKLLYRSAKEEKNCIVISHAAFYPDWETSSPDSTTVCDIFKAVNKIRPGTVIMSINGHYHKHHILAEDDIVFFDVNTVINGCWLANGVEHYFDEHTFSYEKYDENGKLLSKETTPLSCLAMSRNTWFFESPLSAIVTVAADGSIKIEGAKTGWIYGIAPEKGTGRSTEISDFEINLGLNGKE